MKVRSVVLFCSLLLALAVIPTRLFADAFCDSDHSIYQYQPCGTVASQSSFVANSLGGDQGLIGDFQGYHADFEENVFALVWRNGSLIFNGQNDFSSPLNDQLSQYQTFTLVPSGVMQTGDQVEFVLHVTNDPNGDHYFYSSQLNKNLDGLNHTWGSSLAQQQCDPNRAGACAFVGFEDLPMGEGSDFDYNDFKMFVYGADSVPEPSSIVLLTGAPLVFLANKLRRLL